MNRIRHITVILAGLAATVAAFAATGPAALATQVPPPGQLGGHPVKHAPVTPAHVHTVVVGGMPGWQITLIAAGAALAAAGLAVLADRAWAARKTRPSTA